MPRTFRQAIGFLLGLWIALWLSPLRASGEPEFRTLESAIHVEVNAIRTQRHLIQLQRLPELDAVARAHSRDMAQRGYFAHESPEGSNPLDRLTRTRSAIVAWA